MSDAVETDMGVNSDRPSSDHAHNQPGTNAVSAADNALEKSRQENLARQKKKTPKKRKEDDLPDVPLSHYEHLTVKSLQDRIYEECHIVVDRRDPMFAIASVIRAHLDEQQNLFERHNDAINKHMTNRVEVMTECMTTSLNRLQEEALTKDLKQLLQSIHSSSKNISATTSKFSELQEIALNNQKTQNRFLKIITAVILSGMAMTGILATLTYMILK